MNSELLKIVEAGIVLAFACPGINAESDISGSSGPKAAPKVFTEKKAKLMAQKTGSVSNTPSRWDARQLLHDCTLQFRLALFRDYLSYEICRRLFPAMWSLV